MLHNLHHAAESGLATFWALDFARLVCLHVLLQIADAPEPRSFAYIAPVLQSITARPTAIFFEAPGANHSLARSASRHHRTSAWHTAQRLQVIILRATTRNKCAHRNPDAHMECNQLTYVYVHHMNYTRAEMSHSAIPAHSCQAYTNRR